MRLELIAFYGHRPSLVGPDAGLRVAEYNLKRGMSFFARDHYIDVHFPAPSAWVSVDNVTRELVYSGPPIQTVVPASIDQTFLADVPNNTLVDQEELPLTLFSVGVCVEYCKEPGVHIGHRLLWCANSLTVIDYNASTIDLRNTNVSWLEIYNCKSLEIIRSTELVQWMILVCCGQLKLVDGMGNVEYLRINKANHDLRIEGRAKFSNTLRYLYLTHPIASIPIVMHELLDFDVDSEDRRSYTHTRTRMRQDRERAATHLFMVWRTIAGGTFVNPKHPSLLRYAFEFLYRIV